MPGSQVEQEGNTYAQGNQLIANAVPCFGHSEAVLHHVTFYTSAGHSVVSAEGFVEHMRTASGADNVVCIHAISVAVTPTGVDGPGREKTFSVAQSSGRFDDFRQEPYSRATDSMQNDPDTPDCKRVNVEDISVVERLIKDDMEGASSSIAALAPLETGMSYT